jgi:hypothetical protein
MPKPISMPQPLGIFAGELFERSKDYLEAFERLSTSPGRELRYPMYFLFAHSLEVALKAYLASQNVSKKKIFACRHDLTVLHRRCLEAKMPAVPDLEKYIAGFHEMNGDHDFRYPTGYNLHVPPPAHCLEFMQKLRAAISAVVTSAHAVATLEFASNTRHLRGQKVAWSD